MNNSVKNTIANLTSRIWTMLANFLFVPLYIKYLGSEAYGLVTFFATMQTVLNLLGLGLSKTLRREFAADEKKKSKLYKFKILKSVELVYILIAIMIVLLCFLGSNIIANNWLNIEQLNIDVVRITISLMGLSIAFQLVANLYYGCLLGIEQQVKANCIQICWSIIKNVGVIIWIKNYPDIRIFYIWHCVSDILYLIILRVSVILYLKGENEKLKWEFSDLKNLSIIYKFALGVMLISLGYALNTQIDKVIISGKFSLTEVGAYNTAYNLGYVASAISAAIGIMAFSRFAYYNSIKEIDKQKKVFININRKANIIICTFGAFVAVFAKELIMIWTRDENIVNIISNVAPLIIIGTTLSAVQEIPYDFLLASGITIINNIQTICCIAYVVIFMPMMIHFWGIFGAGISWLIEMFIATSCYLCVFYNKYFKGNVFKYLLYDLYIPLLGSIIISIVVKSVFSRFSIFSKIIIAAFFGIITILFWMILLEKDFIKSKIYVLKEKKN